MLKKTYNTKYRKSWFHPLPLPPLTRPPPILIIVIWSEQGSEPEVRVTKDEGEGGCGQWVRGCHNNAVVMLWVLSQL